MMSAKNIDSVTFAKALADETRQQIMSLCCCKWLNVSQIVDGLHVSQPTVSHHLNILRAAGLVDSRREGKQVFYSLNQKRIADACCQVAVNFAPELKLVLNE